LTLIELVATFFGLACVWLTIRQSVWCWPVGLVQVGLYVWIFLHARLYSDVLLHVVYVGLGVYGWYHWVRGGARGDGGAPTVPVSTLSRGAAAGWIAVAAAGTGVLGLAMHQFTDASLPYWDAAIASLSLVAQYLLARKVLETWPFWVVVDVLAIGVYGTKGLYITCGLYSVFLVLALTGWAAWRTSMQARRDPERPAAGAAPASSLASSSPRTAAISS
jgi:nicotinamide mononucleotide transporter